MTTEPIERYEDRRGYFVNDRHALYVGWVLGAAMRRGLFVYTVDDEHGNNTDRIDWVLRPGVTVRLVVPPPPDDWSVTDDD